MPLKRETIRPISTTQAPRLPAIRREVGSALGCLWTLPLRFDALWRRVGLSVDWRQEYSTIDDRCRRAAHLSFLDLYRKGHVYSNEAPTMWDVDFQTAVAQAEVEDRKAPSHYYHLRFAVADSPESFVIATTRPELLAACVGVAAHPADARYRHLFDKHAVTPVFHAPVPVFPSKLVDP